jgi:hypothetical protein
VPDYTAAEIDSAVTEDGLWDELDYVKTAPVTLRGEDVQVKFVAGETGGEGSAEDIWLVIKVGDQYFRKEGWYYSHDASHWDGDLREVHPEEKTITVYE